MTMGSSPFNITPILLSLPKYKQDYIGIPLSNMTKVPGVNLTNELFLLDFNADNSLVWSSTCKYNYTNPPNSTIGCNEQPVLADDSFRPNDLSMSKVTENKTILYNGYDMNVTEYYGSICIEAACKWQHFFAAEDVFYDNYLYDYKVHSGFAGLGVYAPFWNTFTDPDIMQAKYSISTSRNATVDD